MSGILYGVSVGVGDPELLTVKAVKTIEKCEIIAVVKTKQQNSLAFDIASGICDMSNKKLLEIEFLMTRDENLLKNRHNSIANEIKSHLISGKNVAMLNLGDVSVYSTFAYIMEILQADGQNVEMIPGITSFCAVASKLKIGLTSMSKPIHIFPAGKLEEIIDLEGTKIVMKTGKDMPNVKKILKNRAKGQKIMAVSNCGLENEVICNNLDEISDDLGYFTTIIIKE